MNQADALRETVRLADMKPLNTWLIWSAVSESVSDQH